MANTLKFGSGQWATKVGSTLAYNDEGGNFKPLPFNFTRSTGGTRVNKDGLIEMVTNNKPRIDFLNDSNGALLLEPQRTNLALYSEQFDNAGWTKFNASVTANDAVSPDGYTNADALVGNGTTSYHYIINTFASATSGTAYTASFFAKKGSVNFVQLVLDSSSFGVLHQNFDLLNGTIGSGSGSITPFIESYGNDWYRVGITVTATANLPIKPYIAIASSASMARFGSFATSGDIKIYGLQIEAGSYATSYIPTQGAISTRVAETCTQTTPSGIIGQTEGVVYMDFLSVNNFEGSSGNLFEIKEDNNNRINIYFSNGTPRLYGIEDSSGVFNQALSLTTGSVCKLAIKYNSTSTKVFINGSLSHTLNGINNIAFNNYSFLPNNNIDYNEIKIYNTALTDQELINLTTI